VLLTIAASGSEVGVSGKGVCVGAAVGALAGEFGGVLFITVEIETSEPANTAVGEDEEALFAHAPSRKSALPRATASAKRDVGTLIQGLTSAL